jgi:hypothetical protein
MTNPYGQQLPRSFCPHTTLRLYRSTLHIRAEGKRSIYHDIGLQSIIHSLCPQYINYCRLLLNVISIADMTDTSGKYVASEMYQIKRNTSNKSDST